MTYLAQFRRRGFRKWEDIGEYLFPRQAMSALNLIDRGAYRVRILAIPRPPESVAEAFYSEPTVYFEGRFP